VRVLAIACLSLGLAACVPTPRPAEQTPPATLPPGFPEPIYQEAALRGEAVYRLEPGDSSLVVHVYRGGTLARLGHDHVISSRELQGYVLLADEPSRGRADVYVALAGMTVDDPELRAQAGFETQPSEKDIEGTRANMLEKVLDVETYPFVELEARIAMGGPPRVLLEIDLTWNGTTRRITVPADLEIDGGRLRVSGAFELWQSGFGIEPFSVLGGALRVEDRIDLRFVLTGQRWSGR
jgi:polyisoprenoid-binding protein YceI